MHRGEIYLVDLSNQVGSEQTGIRPALIVQNEQGNQHSPTTIICPLTSQDKTPIETHVTLTPQDAGILKVSTVLCEQVRVVDKTRLKKKLGEVVNRSFANIAACVDKSSIDMNAITKIQGLLNHSDQRVTMRYLGTYQQMFDRARESVSDFVLGKTDIHKIVAGNNYTIDDIVSKIDQLEKKLSN